MKVETLSNFHDYSFNDVFFGTMEHFIISLVAGFALYIGYRKYPLRVVLAAVCVIFIDLDHFSPLIDMTNGVKMFHNLLFTFILPLLLMVIFYLMSRRSHQYGKVYTVSLFFVMLSGYIWGRNWRAMPELRGFGTIHPAICPPLV